MSISTIAMLQACVAIVLLAACSCWAGDDDGPTTNTCMKQKNTCKTDCLIYFIYWTKCFQDCDVMMSCCEEIANGSVDEHFSACQSSNKK